ncbi:MAG: DEAD/DEAH box helicase, partial [Solirubrobacterales bacterium]
MASEAKKSAKGDPLAPFSAATRAWFENSFEAATPAQAMGWPAISSGNNALICAPTGSGKTLAAFLWGIDRLAREKGAEGDSDSAAAEVNPGVRLVYVSPLKALSYDIERNLRAPLAGIGAPVSVGLRTGDTPQRDRQAMRRKPPDILITTPESLYLMLSSQAREILTGVEAVIVDEIHAVAQSKRGAHLALTLERLAHRVIAEGGKDPQRIGLSATQRPLDVIGKFLVGPRRDVEIVDVGIRKQLDLKIQVPVDDMSDPGAGLEASPADGEPNFDGATNPRSIWPAIYPELLELVREHTSTIVFVNNRRGAERLAKRLNELANEDLDAADDGAGAAVEVARAHHGSLAHEERIVVEELLKSGQLPCLVATSSLELGIDMGAVDLVIQVESPKSVTRGLQRIGRAGHGIGEVSRGRIFPKFRADLLECTVVAQRMREGKIEETVIPRDPLDVLAQHLVSICADEEWEVSELEKLVTATDPFFELSSDQLENVLDMLDGRYPSERFAELRPRLAWDRIAGTVRGRKGARQLVVTNAGTIPDRGLFGVHLPDGRRVGELDEEMVYEARPGQTFLLGATTWRIEQITRDRVIVTPAPGVPGAIPFWRGDGIGRPAELGKAIGAFSREAVSMKPATLAKKYSLDRRAA